MGSKGSSVGVGGTVAGVVAGDGVCVGIIVAMGTGAIRGAGCELLATRTRLIAHAQTATAPITILKGEGMAIVSCLGTGAACGAGLAPTAFKDASSVSCTGSVS